MLYVIETAAFSINIMLYVIETAAFSIHLKKLDIEIRHLKMQIIVCNLKKNKKKKIKKNIYIYI
jgi:hypothetical protein